MAFNLKDQLNQAEDCIISGRISEAASLLSKVPLAKIPRADAARAAKLFRRVGAFEAALRILLPIVRPKARLLQPATAHETAECAMALQRAGSLEEACDLLEQVSVEEAPEALLYRTIFKFSEWDYRGGISHILKLINLCPQKNYLYRLAKLNLAAAFVVEEKYEEASILLRELRAEASEHGEYLTFCNALEVSAQVAIFTGNYSEASMYLSEAEKILKGSQSLDWLWIFKWRAILDASTQKSLAPLEKARQEALEKRHWETLRELDFAACRISNDENTIRKLYFGTTFAGYRRRLIKLFGEPTATHATIGPKGVYEAQNDKSINLFCDLEGELKPGDLPHILLLMLVSDAYRSLRSGQIHSRLFPGEFFNPYTSLDRVHHVVQRLRKALSEQIPGLEIYQDNGVYKLDFSNFTSYLEIPKKFPEMNSLEIKLYSLKERLKTDQFKSQDVQTAFSLSRSAANQLISQWRKMGAIETQGKTRTPIYIVKKAA